MLNLTELLDTYRAVKAHDDALMNRRPDKTPRAAWRMENPHRLQTSWRVLKSGKTYSALLNYDTKPELRIMTWAQHSRLVDIIDLSGSDAADRLSAFQTPASNDMIATEFGRIREKLGLTQASLAPLLDFRAAIRVSEFERATNPKRIPPHIARIMNAMKDGWRPSDWQG